MSDRTVHETIAVERVYNVPVARVFAAFADAAQRARWDVPEDGWELAEFVDDFRVGGRTASRFGPTGDPRFYSDGVYLAIEPNVRIISAGTMHDRDKPMTCTLNTVELVPKPQGTRVIITEQSAYFGMETSRQRRNGWESILNKLARHFLEEQTP